MTSKYDLKKKLILKFKEDFARNKSVGYITKTCAKNKQTVGSTRRNKCYLTVAVVTVVTAVLVAVYGVESLSEISPVNWHCLLDHNEISMEITRPLFDCNFCKNLDTFPIVSDINSEQFEQSYAFTGVPVVIQNAAKNWTALDAFSVKFFRDLYQSDVELMKKANDDCQFFPYFTAWNTLGDALNMTEEEEALTGKRWYIGWNNCVPEIEKILRTFYTKPHFLPQSGGYVRSDWIFMGGSGRGAPSHIDSVGRPSWQAQIRGQKTWYLDPPAECEHLCRSLAVVMNASDIIAVDTDHWYHSTYVHPGDISITIGSEYD